MHGAHIGGQRAAAFFKLVADLSTGLSKFVGGQVRYQVVRGVPARRWGR
jgi:hypothetical protein